MEANRGDAVAATRIVRGGASRRRRGRDADSPRRRVARRRYAPVAAVAQPPQAPVLTATVVGATPATGNVVGIAPNQPMTLAQKMHRMQDELDLPEDIVTDLMSVAGTDIVVIADDSGSMSCVVDPSNHYNPQSRWAELKTTLTKLSHMLLVVDHTDGFHVQFLNDPTWHNVHTKEHLETLFYGRQPRGRTPLAERLRPILDGSWHPKGHSNETDIILLVMTDGEPSDCSFESLRTMVAQKRKNVYLTFMMCTEDDDVVDKYNKYVDHLPGVDITDDYASEKREVEGFGRSLPSFSLRGYISDESRGDAAAATWLFRGDESTPRPRRGNSVETGARRRRYYKWLAKAVLGGKMYKYDHMDEMSRRNGGGGCCTIA